MRNAIPLAQDAQNRTEMYLVSIDERVERGGLETQGTRQPGALSLQLVSVPASQRLDDDVHPSSRSRCRHRANRRRDPRLRGLPGNAEEWVLLMYKTAIAIDSWKLKTFSAELHANGFTYKKKTRPDRGHVDARR